MYDPNERHAFQSRDTPGGGLEVLDADGVWRHVPAAAATFIRHHQPKGGLTDWEWHIGQVYSVGLVPRSRTEAEWDTAGRFRDACEARFPDQVKKFSDYMGWNDSRAKSAE